MKRSLLLLTLLWAATSIVVAAAPAPDKLLSADTLAVLTIPDMQQAKTKTADWPMWRLWQDPSMKPFKDKFLAKFKTEVVEPMERELGAKLSDYSALVQGQVTLAVTRGTWDGKDGGRPGFLLLVDAKDKSEALQTQLNQLKKKWIDNGKQLKTEKIRDVEFSIINVSSADFSKKSDKAPAGAAAKEEDKGNAAKAGGDKMEWLIGQSDSLLVVGSAAKDVEKVLVRQAGGAVPGLGELNNFATSYSSVLRDSVGYGWLNLQSVWDTVAKLAAADAAEPGNEGIMGVRPDQLLAATGLQGLEAASFAVRDIEQGAILDGSLSIPAAKRKGIFQVFALEPLDANPPAFVPADAVKFMRVRMDIPKMWNQLETLVGQVSPQAAGVFKLLIDNAGKDKDPNFDLRKNLIANIGNDLVSYEKIPRQQTLEALMAPPTIWMVGSPQPEQLAAALKALGSLLPNQTATLKEREFLGRKVFSLPLPASEGADGKMVERVLHYAASGSYVALSTDETMLEEFLRSSGTPGKSLRELPGLAEAAEKVGGMSMGFFSYENYQATTRATFEVLKKNAGKLDNLLAVPLGEKVANDDIKEWVDFSLLPEFDKVSKYFNFSVCAGGLGADGFRFKVYMPDSPKLK